MKMRNIISCIFSIVLFSCRSVDVDKAKQNSWKNNDGAYIRDIIIFGNEKSKGFYLDSELKVHYNGKFVGTVVEANSKKMVILTPKNEKSYYVSF